eukprot:XP_027303031.1 cohesin subunit SA-3-like [Anas platyrhynchos]
MSPPLCGGGRVAAGLQAGPGAGLPGARQLHRPLLRLPRHGDAGHAAGAAEHRDHPAADRDLQRGLLRLPLSLSTGPWRRFRASFGAVVTAVALRSRHAVLYDGFLLSGLTVLLTSLADSQVRAFRHTATLAAMKLMTALVEVALGLSQRRDNTQRLYEAERGKSPPGEPPASWRCCRRRCGSSRSSRRRSRP